jgi:23S rRNA U2552 (ribose-2'-O)-methylase RlmE/FtsJ
MKIPQELINNYKTIDPESEILYELFDEPPNSKILEIGSHDAPTASMLSSCGFDVTGIDLRDCDQKLNYKHIKANFCDMPQEFVIENLNKFDSIISISAIEHFGLNTYGEGRYRSHLDVIAMRKIYEFLKIDGTCYVSVPFGGKFTEFMNHWRVYDFHNLKDRIIQDFQIELLIFKICEDIFLMDKLFKRGETTDFVHACFNLTHSPAISAFMKLRKVA